MQAEGTRAGLSCFAGKWGGVSAGLRKLFCNEVGIHWSLCRKPCADAVFKALALSHCWELAGRWGRLGRSSKTKARPKRTYL